MQQAYNVAGAIGTFCLLPSVWSRMDVPDLIVMGAPKASMVIVGSEDILFPPEAVSEAFQQIQQGYDWADCHEKASLLSPPIEHCYNLDCQSHAISWFKKYL
jgi:hypothetical protein